MADIHDDKLGVLTQISRLHSTLNYFINELSRKTSQGMLLQRGKKLIKDLYDFALEVERTETFSAHLLTNKKLLEQLNEFTQEVLNFKKELSMLVSKSASLLSFSNAQSSQKVKPTQDMQRNLPMVRESTTLRIR